MRNSIVSLLFLFITGCNKMTLPIEYIPTPGETITCVIPDPDGDMLVRITLVGFPKEIYFGDPVYFVFEDENPSSETLFNHPTLRLGLNGMISSHSILQTYSWISEYPSTESIDILLPTKNLLPGEKCRIGNHDHHFPPFVCEFPPLEDWNGPFWNELRENMLPEGIACQFQLSFWNPSKSPSSQRDRISVTQDILIKPRPKSEMALLEKWYNNTPEKLFPKVDGNRKVPHDIDLRSSGESDITISGNKYDPWLFIRLGNRKPSDPNNPTTLAGWRQLEASLTPSTMRDEVRLTRLQLEYYSAKPGEASENAKNELVEWLKSLPGVQRTIYLTFLISKMGNFAHSRDNYKKPTPLGEKNRELIRVIYDMLDNDTQKSVCQ